MKISKNFIDSLTNNKTLKILDLGNCRKKKYLEDELIEYVLKSLEKNEILENLTLESEKISKIENFNKFSLVAEQNSNFEIPFSNLLKFNNSITELIVFDEKYNYDETKICLIEESMKENENSFEFSKTSIC